MKRILSVILAAVVLASSLVGCSSAPTIDEYGIYMTEEEFVDAYSKELGTEISKKFFYEIGGNTNETLSIDTIDSDESSIQYIVIRVSGATEDKADSVKRSTELFKSVIKVLYPDTDMEELDNTLKEIRYIEEENEMSPKSHRFNDVYITFYTTYGPDGLMLTDTSVTEANWKLQVITDYNK